MTAESKKILTLVQALMDKTVERGATPEESASAAAKAQAILFKYNLALADLELLGESAKGAEYGREDVDLLAAGKAMVNWHRTLVNVIARNNFCRAVATTAYKRSGRNVVDRVAIIGKPHNIEFVRWLYGYVAVQIRTMALLAMRENCLETLPGPQGAWTRSFCLGAVSTIGRRLYEQRHRDETATAQSTALVHVTDAQLDQAQNRYVGKVTAGVRGAPSRDTVALMLGREAGTRVSIHRPLTGAAPWAALGKG